MPSLLECLAVPVLKCLVKLAGNAAGGFVIPIGDLIVDVGWEAYSKWKNDGQMRAEFEKLAQGQPDLQRHLVALMERLAPNQPAEIKKKAVTYLSMVPGTIQRSLRRPEDPSGRSLPESFRLRSAADLRQVLPYGLPRFDEGDRPIPGTDLVLDKFKGIGGFGEVWKAIHENDPSAPPVALKFGKDDSASKSLQREAELLDRVAKKGRHPNIIQLIDTHFTEKFVCLEFEYVNGGDLARLSAELHAANEAAPDHVVRIMLQLAKAVGFAHSLRPPIVHRDLKPANVLVTRAGGKVQQLKVADFGIGGIASERVLKESRETARASGRTTLTSAYTPLYASPQQRRGNPRDPRDDVYALGVIWYQLSTGDLTGEAPRGTGWKQRLAQRGMTAQMIELLEQCMEDHEKDRPRNAVVLAERLSDCLRSSAGAQNRPPLTEPREYISGHHYPVPRDDLEEDD